MSTTAIPEAPTYTMVGMGQVVVVHKPNRLTAVLGSCIGVALYHNLSHAGVLSHVVLPESNGRNDNPGRYADTAIHFMLEQLRKHGIPTSGLIAKIAGGACMFGSGGPLQIGEANIKSVTEHIAKAGIRLAGQDVGGRSGRRVIFEPSGGTLTIEVCNIPTKIL